MAQGQREDRPFLRSAADCAVHAEGCKQLRMEYSDRQVRKRNRVLMDADEPAGGQWNYDSENVARYAPAEWHSAGTAIEPDELHQRQA